MNKKILTTAIAASALAAIAATPAVAAKSKDSKSKKVTEKQTKTTGFGSVFRKRSTNDTRRLNDGRGPGFELGFDGHTGGL